MPHRPTHDLASLELMDLLVQTSFAVIALLNQMAAAHDLSITQFRVLAILRDREPKMAELAAHLGLEKSSVSGLIDRAVDRGLVRRSASRDDARAVRVGLTAKGRRVADRVTDEVAAGVLPLADPLGPADRDRLRELLRTLLGQT